MNICLNKKEAPLITCHCIHLIQYCHDHHHSSIHKHCKCLKTFDFANFCNLLILLFFANFRFCKFSIYKHCRSPCIWLLNVVISSQLRAFVKPYLRFKHNMNGEFTLEVTHCFTKLLKREQSPLFVKICFWHSFQMLHTQA